MRYTSPLNTINMKRDYSLHLFAFIILVTVVCVGIATYQEDNTHHCKWENCPYVDINITDAIDTVIDNNPGDDSSDAVVGTILHIKYGNKTYEQIEDMMFKDN